VSAPATTAPGLPQNLLDVGLGSLGVTRRPVEVRSPRGPIRVPLTSGFFRIDRREYRASPRPVSLTRKMLNSVLWRLARAGLFETGRWADVAGDRGYGDWLGVPPSRYDVLNLPGVPGATVFGDFDDPVGFDGLGPYDGVLCLNSYTYSRRPEVAVANTFGLLRPGGIAVLDFPVSHYWYAGDDGDHWQTYNPFLVDTLVRAHCGDYVIVPVGNLVHAAADFYGRRGWLKPWSGLLHAAGLLLGRLDSSPQTALHYVVLALKAGASAGTLG
jgi:SAM-dependent methyltransferase